uniref:Holocytochrome c-type synthase n=1 Tax=Chaetoceros debilis TaxID=122233 RepID=A0A7S3QEP1_9STRA|mmetsp:Transcript_7035/g.10387  ORF Transcript_7035/g.10387 Transcript_7035/m.10387 type:complete len:491 (-) Transcript_7035:2200-3672(-)|eukprot:CAMPEP_0194097754 /NCGR_PEP_ID=MMETSP0149-20130528/58026_1 /TAXON_ID=122233 /ORGANISM="Chaetoceros debilis, Strain MM31A-1" /LENGTH=490 /DNA_ID=CAMNT_0038783783 /DNA_START=54 /DNA_END=1526 /DNA_ORIENTATION=-
MGSKQSKQVVISGTAQNEITGNKPEATTSLDTKPLNHPVVSGSGGGCPMKKNDGGYLGGFFSKKPKGEEETPNASKSESASSSSTSGCPVKMKSSSSKTQYNVYSQPIDPKNNMPAVANQLPNPHQSEKLDTIRVKSKIPKGGSDEDTWTYPSPQMFYNSLARKNKLGDTEESDIESVVAIHNNMNEKTWSKVVEWEDVLDPDGQKSGGPKLLKFLGRPSDLSPKAKFKNIVFGYPLPFDRHDWTVCRPDGTEVRYVIDYYFDESSASEREDSGMPNMNDRDAVKSVLVDVRPAADSAGSMFGRAVTMPYARHFEKSTRFEPLPILPTSDLKSQIGESEKVWANIQQSVQESKKVAEEKSMVLKREDLPNGEIVDINISDKEAKEIAKSFVTMLDQCKSVQKLVEECKDDEDCAKASLALTMCLAKVVCPLQQETVATALSDDNFDSNDEKAAEAYNARFEKALENMSVCVNSKSQRAVIAREKYPEAFQ